MDADNAQDALRAAHLTDTIGTHDLDVAAELKDTAAELATREAELKTQRADLEKTLASLAPLNDLLQQKLEVATVPTTRCTRWSSTARRSTAPTSPPARPSAR